MILGLRTDKPEAELYIVEGGSVVYKQHWQAHRALAETLHRQIEIVLDSQGRTLADIAGIIVYNGSGSFTGLRIGISVVNALGYSLHVPVVSVSDETWLSDGLQKMAITKNYSPIVPEYSSPVFITEQKR